MTDHVLLGDRPVGPGHPTLVVAELSGNHRGDLGVALAIVDAAAEAGADAVKLQTYTADSLTLDSPRPWFQIEGTAWAGRRLHDLYREAMTPWSWTEPLFERARSHGMLAFSTPFDAAALEHLEALDPPAHKVASFELVDHELLRAVAATGRPVIASTGMADAEEIEEAVAVLREAGDGGLVLLRCNSGYPAPTTEMDLRTIGDMQARWGVPVGLSDHTLDTTAATTAVALGAVLLEKHLTLRRDEGGPDAGFSLEPSELAALVTAVRAVEAALGEVRYGPSPAEAASRKLRRSLFFVRDLPAGSTVRDEDIRSVRPAAGLAPKHRDAVLGRRTARAVAAGTPVTWDDLEGAGAP